MATYKVLMALLTLALMVIVACSSPVAGADVDRPYRKDAVPDSTSIRTSFETERGSGPDMLLDANEKTRMVPVGNTAGTPSSIFLRFIKPLEDLAGVALGPSDALGNYFPEEIRFFVDTTGNGTYDQYVGRAVGLGPKEKTAGDYLFDRKPAKVFGLEIRIVKQSRRGAQRAAILTDLSLLYSNATWGGELIEPQEGKNTKPMDIRADIEAPIPLLRWSQAKNVTVLKADQNRQTVKVVETDGKSVLDVTWKTDGKSLAEVSPGGSPALHLFNQGVVLSIPVNTAACPGFTGLGVRVVDSQGETFQWGGNADPKNTGWQDVRILLDPARSSGNWGGGAEGKGKIDEPVRIATLVFNAPKTMPATGGTILVRDIHRNTFDPSQVGPEVLLKQLKATTTSARPTMVFTPKDKGPVALRVTHTGELPVDATLAIDATDFNGATARWNGPVLTVKPGESADVSVDPTFAMFGWYELSILAVSPDGKTSAAIGKTMAAYVEPAGVQSLPPANEFWLGIDARLSSKKDQWVVDACAQAGFDLLRAGGWDGHTGPGKFDHRWRHTLMGMAKDANIKPFNSITFTPGWAVQEKDKGKNPASRYAPREEALREYIREIVPINKQYGVTIYDLWNEPDLSGFFKGTTDEYLEFMRVAYDEIKKNQPDAMVLSGGIAVMQGHGGHGLNPDMIGRMIVDGQDSYDAISLHLHGDFKTFQEQIDGPVAQYRKQLRKDKPMFFTETGVTNASRRVGASELMKKIVFARARGAIGFTTFVFHYRNEIAYSLMNAGPSFEPFPAWVAHNELAKLMRSTRFVRQIDVGPGLWVFEFEGSRQTLLVGWDESADDTGQQALVVLPTGAAANRIDLMGNAQEMTAMEGVAPWGLSRTLSYLTIQNGKPDVLGSLASFKDEPSAEPGQAAKATISLRNPLQREATFVLDWTDHNGAVKQDRITVAARALSQASMDTLMPSVARNQRPRVKVAFSIEGTPWKGEASVAINAAQSIPAGDITLREADYILETDNHIQNNNAADPTRAKYTWKGVDDLSARMWLSLDDKNLNVTIRVKDDQHHQPNDPANMWRADGVQFAMQVPERGSYWLIGFARDDTGKHCTFAWSTPTGMSADYAKKIKLKTERTDSETVYRASLPLDGLGATGDQLRSRTTSVNLVVNDDDNDGGGRKGFAYIAKGLGVGAVTPQEWPRVTFK